MAMMLSEDVAKPLANAIAWSKVSSVTASAMFPEENHGLTRTGKLYNQVRHLSEMTSWFVKYLSEGGQENE